MVGAWLAQVGASPGGVAMMYAVIALFLLLLFACLAGFILMGVLKSGFGENDPVLAIRWPGRWVRVRPPVIKPYAELSKRQREAIFAVRAEVFLVEQGITGVPDRDGVDPECEHVMVYAGRRLVGTARLQTLPEPGVIKVGRLAVLKPFRGRGIGVKIMESVHEHLRRRGFTGVMNAQLYLESWYQRLGWVREGEPFTEAGLPHIRMRYRAVNAS